MKHEYDDQGSQNHQLEAFIRKLLSAEKGTEVDVLFLACNIVVCSLSLLYMYMYTCMFVAGSLRIYIYICVYIYINSTCVDPYISLFITLSVSLAFWCSLVLCLFIMYVCIIPLAHKSRFPGQARVHISQTSHLTTTHAIAIMRFSSLPHYHLWLGIDIYIYRYTLVAQSWTQVSHGMTLHNAQDIWSDPADPLITLSQLHTSPHPRVSTV